MRVCACGSMGCVVCKWWISKSKLVHIVEVGCYIEDLSSAGHVRKQAEESRNGNGGWALASRISMSGFGIEVTF